jgi:hypothetical protein
MEKVSTSADFACAISGYLPRHAERYLPTIITILRIQTWRYASALGTHLTVEVFLTSGQKKHRKQVEIVACQHTPGN